MTGQSSELDEIITFIHRHIDEPLPLSRLAGHAAYSPYHFTRLFKEKTGLPPQYYISSLRLQKAKDLLLRTHLSVRDVSLEIGQQSLGTFTTRFTERVGMTPSEFRNSAQQAAAHLRTLRSYTDWDIAESLPASADRIEGSIRAEEPFEGVILIGLFARPIPEGIPLYGTVLPSLGRFSFTGVKPGTYYLMATSVSWGMRTMEFLLPETTLRTRSKEPIVVTPHTRVPHQQVVLYPPRLDDPPILISLPLLMNRFLHGVLQGKR
ncbi:MULTISPECIES: helix-turn-helix domain-containing protein [Paenibacillus]|uniref:helix-turn-helix domain-containing protein n=1 Tax=Paenibacillus TaxID=44249 RepID=UPI0022B93DBD|nr:helix-turn-helix transcriptional regulator [Paenibacillus caseinilyticus]MCZ8520404.1 helix-turn-helix transcriptional regulator [Paenibacillus caseinilyticus]